MKKTMLFALAAFAPLAIASAVAAAEDAPIATADAPVTASEIVVQAQIAYRNRSEQTAPVLEYGLDYFQRFEPLTAGDALKRVPSVTFLSDVLESDGARLRGLDAAYTQILINGEKVPGAGADRSFFVDRIPAEMIERKIFHIQKEEMGLLAAISALVDPETDAAIKAECPGWDLDVLIKQFDAFGAIIFEDGCKHFLT